MIGIYKITSPSNRVYIGQSIDIESRFNHYKLLHCDKQVRLFASFKKYGVDSHWFDIIELCRPNELNRRERYWQDYYNVLSGKGLNCVLTGYDDVFGERSAVTKAKISKANSGKGNGMYGKKLPPYRVKQLRALKHSAESIKKISARSKGENNPAAKIVLNTSNGIYYGCVGDAAETIGVKRDTLKQWLNGRRKNKSTFIYA